MPTISIYLPDDMVDFLNDSIGRGNVSPYIQTLINRDKGRVEFEKDKKFFDWIMNLGLLFVGLAFILLVVGTNFKLEWTSTGYILVMLSGGVLLVMQGISKMYGERKVKKNGINNTNIV